MGEGRGGSLGRVRRQAQRAKIWRKRKGLSVVRVRKDWYRVCGYMWGLGKVMVGEVYRKRLEVELGCEINVFFVRSN